MSRSLKVALATIRKKRLNQQDSLLMECRGALLAPGVNWAAIGRAAGVGGGTVKNLATSTTVRPQFVTVLAVLAALDYEIVVRAPRAGHQPITVRRPEFARRVSAARQVLLEPKRTRRA